jgi:5-bromo-4-chloroindolyl phosphate hydrolysis protein
MVNREIIRRKLEKLESNLTKTDFILKRSGNLDEFLQVTNEMKELVKELKSYIEYEPRSANEMNSSAR